MMKIKHAKNIDGRGLSRKHFNESVETISNGGGGGTKQQHQNNRFHRKENEYTTTKKYNIEYKRIERGATPLSTHTHSSINYTYFSYSLLLYCGFER